MSVLLEKNYVHIYAEASSWSRFACSALCDTQKERRSIWCVQSSSSATVVWYIFLWDFHNGSACSSERENEKEIARVHIHVAPVYFLRNAAVFRAAQLLMPRDSSCHAAASHAQICFRPKNENITQFKCLGLLAQRLCKTRIQIFKTSFRPYNSSLKHWRWANFYLLHFKTCQIYFFWESQAKTSLPVSVSVLRKSTDISDVLQLKLWVSYKTLQFE